MCIRDRNEDMRPSDNKGILKIGVSQSIAWPGLYKAQRNLYSEQLKYYQANTVAIEADIKKNVRSVYYQLWYLQDKQQLYHRLDSIYKSLNDAAILKVKTGDSRGLDSIAANVRMLELQALLQQMDKEIQIQQQSLMQYLNAGEMMLPLLLPLEKLPMYEVTIGSEHPVSYTHLLCLSLHLATRHFAYAKRRNIHAGKPHYQIISRGKDGGG